MLFTPKAVDPLTDITNYRYQEFLVHRIYITTKYG